MRRIRTKIQEVDISSVIKGMQGNFGGDNTDHVS